MSVSSPTLIDIGRSRVYRALALVTLFGMVFGGFLVAQPQSVSAQGTASVTAYLNLRNNPSTSAAIIAVMPPGASVSIDGDAQNGFYPLWYGGSYGWAHGDWISFGGATPPSTPGAVGTAYVVDGALNLRSGPSTSNSVITVMPNGSAVSLTGENAGGFSAVVYNGTSGWAFSDYLSVSGPSVPAPPPAPTQPSNPGVGDVVIDNLVTTAALNMRSGPGTGYGIITTIPAGVSVEIMGNAQSGFYPVRYAGNKGWSHGDWLTRGAAPAPTPSPTQPPTPAPTPSPTPSPTPAPSNPGGTTVGDTAIGKMRTTARLSIRTGPGTQYDAITVLVIGATVEIMGQPQNGFYPIRYGNTKGWMHGDWLTSDGAGVPGPPSEAPLPNPEAPAGVPVGDTATGSMYTTVGLNLRQGPGTNYNVITVMPGNVTVDVMGSPVNGFYPLSFHGTKGWASGDYLRTGSATSPNPGNGKWTRDEIIQIIYDAADKYGQPRADMLRVAMCESVLDPYVVNPASGVSGLFQFLPSTWATTPYRNDDIFDPVANANAAGWMWANGRRNEWHCQ